MQYQHLVFEEFARKIQPQIDVFLVEGQIRFDDQSGDRRRVRARRLSLRPLDAARDSGSLRPRLQPGQRRYTANRLIAAFLNPLEFTASGATDAQAAGAIVRGVTRQVGNEIDEFVTEALRNNLLGRLLDLATINLRVADIGVPSLNQARAEFYAMTGDSQLKPYASWADLAYT